MWPALHDIDPGGLHPGTAGRDSCALGTRGLKSPHPRTQDLGAPLSLWSPGCMTSRGHSATWRCFLACEMKVRHMSEMAPRGRWRAALWLTKAWRRVPGRRGPSPGTLWSWGARTELSWCTSPASCWDLPPATFLGVPGPAPLPPPQGVVMCSDSPLAPCPGGPPWCLSPRQHRGGVHSCPFGQVL